MSSSTLSAWFLYSDRDTPELNPTGGQIVTLQRFWENNKSDFDSPDWRREEWQIRSALVPVDQLHSAAREISSPDDLLFEIGWGSQDLFTFGEIVSLKGITLHPLASMTKHPVTQEPGIEINPKFITYHALIRRNATQYFHPTDNISVLETKFESHEIYEPSAHVTVHRDYLRDFLAAVKMGVLVSVVADRFANAPTEAELELNVVDEVKLDDFTTLSSYIHTPEETHHGHFRGRSILRRNFAIQPYDRPRFERSPWHYFGEFRAEESELPMFIVNNEGKKQTLPQNGFIPNYIENGIGSFGYLYFRSEVLQKYLQISGYSVSFHMRNWGIASLPGDKGTVDVGINSQGLVNAFAPDIAKLNASEQAYWASFSSLPSGEVCEELFQTRMQQNPPHSPGVIELIQEVRTLLEEVFKKRYGLDLYNLITPNKAEMSKLSVGPITNQSVEVFALARILYGWVVETMQIASLRSCLSTFGVTADNKIRQIKLLENILIAKGLEEVQAHSITAPLVGLNELRISSAHLGIIELQSGLELMGASKPPETMRAGWTLCVDAVATSLKSIAVAIRA
jgi:hypothetical protein